MNAIINCLVLSFLSICSDSVVGHIGVEVLLGGLVVEHVLGVLVSAGGGSSVVEGLVAAGEGPGLSGGHLGGNLVGVRSGVGDHGGLLQHLPFLLDDDGSDVGLVVVSGRLDDLGLAVNVLLSDLGVSASQVA